jgi:hypothetical protein
LSTASYLVYSLLPCLQPLTLSTASYLVYSLSPCLQPLTLSTASRLGLVTVALLVLLLLYAYRHTVIEECRQRLCVSLQPNMLCSRLPIYAPSTHTHTHTHPPTHTHTHTHTERVPVAREPRWGEKERLLSASRKTVIRWDGGTSCITYSNSLCTYPPCTRTHTTLVNAPNTENMSLRPWEKTGVTKDRA